MGDEDANFVSEEAVDGLIDQMATNVSVHSAQRIVHQINVGVDVEATSQIDPGLLTATEGDSFFAHSRLIAEWEQLHISI